MNIPPNETISYHNFNPQERRRRKNLKEPALMNGMSTLCIVLFSNIYNSKMGDSFAPFWSICIKANIINKRALADLTHPPQMQQEEPRREIMATFTP